MPLETGDYIAALNPSNPPATDGLAQTDDQLRFIKQKVVESFPNIDAAVTATPTDLNNLAGDIHVFGSGTATAPDLRAAAEATLGLYRVSAGKLGLSQGKRIVGNGMLAVGSLHHFPKLPTAGTYTTGGTATANPERIEFLETDGSTYNVADFPDLGAYLGSTFGGNGVSTFAVPDEKTTGRFRRSRTASVTVGTSQSNVMKSHTHAVTGTAASGGAHTHTGTTDNTTPAAVSAWVRLRNDVMGVGSVAFLTNAASGGAADSTWINSNVAHSHTFTTDSGGAHTHTVSGTAAAEAAADTETRPESFVCFACIKT